MGRSAEKHNAVAGDNVKLKAAEPELPPGAFTSKSLPALDDDDATQFMRRIYDAHVRRKLAAGKRYFSGVSNSKLLAVEGEHSLVTAACEDCQWLLAVARSDLQRHIRTLAQPYHLSIGIASAYRTPPYDGMKWFESFKTHYVKTEIERKGFKTGVHGKEAFDLLLGQMNLSKAPGGFSNHSKGLAIDFSTREIIDGKMMTLGPDTSQRATWRKTWFFAWLKENSETFRFVNYKDEEWHYDYVSSHTMKSGGQPFIDPETSDDFA